MLLALTLYFVAVVVRVFRPGARAAHKAAASVVFRNDNKPGGTNPGSGPKSGPKKEA